jgi:23S rRNA (cytosine1962-C5)-methyltransferase
VDISRKALEWGKRNLAANGVALDAHRFICSDVFDYYRRAGRQQEQFDYVILDPPTFARVKPARRAFSLEEHLEPLVAGALELLARGGIMHLSVNHRGTPLRRLEQVIRAAADDRHRRCTRLDPPPLPEDFRGDPEYAKSVLLRVE